MRCVGGGLVAQSRLTLCDPMECSLPDSSGHGIFQARILEWVAISSCRAPSQPRDQTGSPTLQADALPLDPPVKTLVTWWVKPCLTSWPRGNKLYSESAELSTKKWEWRRWGWLSSLILPNSLQLFIPSLTMCRVCFNLPWTVIDYLHVLILCYTFPGLDWQCVEWLFQHGFEECPPTE